MEMDTEALIPLESSEVQIGTSIANDTVASAHFHHRSPLSHFAILSTLNATMMSAVDRARPIDTGSEAR